MEFKKFIEEKHVGYDCGDISYFVHIKTARYEKKGEITVNEVDEDYQTTTIVKYGITKEEALSLMENEEKVLEILEDLVSEMY